LEAQVKQLVRQLDADQLTQRDEAEQALTKLGPDAISLLPPVSDRTPAEVAQRLARVRQALERAEAALATQPALVTLDVEMPLSEAIAAIAKQTGNRIVDHRVEFGQEASDPKVKLKFAKAPFWQALDEVLDQAHLTVYGFAGERGVYLVNRPEGESNRSGKAAYSGPFRVSAARFEAVRDLRSARNQSLKLFTDVAWEPRIMPIAILQPLDQMRAADVSLDGVRVGADSLVGAKDQALPLVEQVVDFATALVCAEAVGAIKYACDATLEYLKTRKQFGVPIGSFQALQHRMVDMVISGEQARSMASLACASVDTESDPRKRMRMVSAAKVRIADACRHVSQESVQLHGGMGMTDEMKISHTFRRLTMIAQQFGDADHHLERFAAL
jgi:CheY-like chemotaxis protein